MKTIGLACDHAGFELKEYVRGWLEVKGWAYKDFGTQLCRKRRLSGLCPSAGPSSRIG